MTYRQHLYIRQTIVWLFYPFDKPILDWLAARTHARVERLGIKVLGLDQLDQQIEEAAVAKRKQEIAVEKAEREQEKQRNLSRVWPGATQPPKQKSITLKSNSTTVSSLLTTPDAHIVCPTCKNATLNVHTETIPYYACVVFHCPNCKTGSKLKLDKDVFFHHPGTLHEKIRVHLSAWPSTPRVYHQSNYLSLAQWNQYQYALMKYQQAKLEHEYRMNFVDPKEING